MEGSWDRLGVLLAPLRPVSGRLSPPGGAPERLREVIFGGILGGIFGSILGAQAEGLKIVIFMFFLFVWVRSLFYLLSAVAFLVAWPAAPRTCKNLEIQLVFVGRKPYAPFSRSAQSNRISEDTRSQH